MSSTRASQFVVLGVHRSGTSLLAQTAIALGLYGGNAEDLDGADRWNANGYWEHKGVRALDEDLLAGLDSDWFGGAAFEPGALPADARADFDARAAAIVAALDAHAPWVIKDPRLCVTLPFWLPRLPRAGFLFSLRHPVAVARSLQARDGFPIQMGLALWEVQLLAAIRSTTGFPCVAFWYEDLIAKPQEETMRLATWLREVTGGRAGTAAGAPAGNPDLRHFTVDPADEGRMPVGARRLLDALRTGEAFSPGFDTTSSDDARELIRFLDDKERTRRYLEAGWRGQQAEHSKAIALHEHMLKTRDEYIADLLRHRD